MTTLLTRVNKGVHFAYFQDVRIIDESRIESLGQDLTNLINQIEGDKLVLNFQNVGFMSSAMIGKLIQFNNRCEAAKVELRLCGINKNIETVFKTMKLEKVFKMEADEDAAIKSFEKRGWFS